MIQEDRMNSRVGKSAWSVGSSSSDDDLLRPASRLLERTQSDSTSSSSSCTTSASASPQRVLSPEPRPFCLRGNFSAHHPGPSLDKKSRAHSHGAVKQPQARQRKMLASQSCVASASTGQPAPVPPVRIPIGSPVPDARVNGGHRPSSTDFFSRLPYHSGPARLDASFEPLPAAPSSQPQPHAASCADTLWGRLSTQPLIGTLQPPSAQPLLTNAAVRAERAIPEPTRRATPPPDLSQLDDDVSEINALLDEAEDLHVAALRAAGGGAGAARGNAPTGAEDVDHGPQHDVGGGVHGGAGGGADAALSRCQPVRHRHTHVHYCSPPPRGGRVGARACVKALKRAGSSAHDSELQAAARRCEKAAGSCSRARKVLTVSAADAPPPKRAVGGAVSRHKLAVSKLQAQVQRLELRRQGQAETINALQAALKCKDDAIASLLQEVQGTRSAPFDAPSAQSRRAAALHDAPAAQQQTAERSATTRKLLEARRSERGMHDAVRELEARLQEGRRDLTQARQRGVALVESLRRAHQEKRELAEEAAGARLRATEEARATTELRGKLDIVRAALGKERRERLEAAAKAAASAEAATAAHSRADELQERLAAAVAERDEARIAAARSSTLAQDAAGKLAAAVAEVQRMKADVRTANRRHFAAVQENAALKDAISRTQESASAMQEVVRHIRDSRALSGSSASQLLAALAQGRPGLQGIRPGSVKSADAIRASYPQRPEGSQSTTAGSASDGSVEAGAAGRGWGAPATADAEVCPLLTAPQWAHSAPSASKAEKPQGPASPSDASIASQHSIPCKVLHSQSAGSPLKQLAGAAHRSARLAWDDTSSEDSKDGMPRSVSAASLDMAAAADALHTQMQQLENELRGEGSGRGSASEADGLERKVQQMQAEMLGGETRRGVSSDADALKRQMQELQQQMQESRSWHGLVGAPDLPPLRTKVSSRNAVACPPESADSEDAEAAIEAILQQSQKFLQTA